MIVEKPSNPRDLRVENHSVDLVVVGGGLSGVCAAIVAARNGAHVVLVQDRPVLGGNASSEVRLWILGATSHGGNNNRWAREGGVINELLLENQFRNPGGNPVIFDTILQDWVAREQNLKVLLNTVMFDTEMDGNEVQKIRAFNSQNSTMYSIAGRLFCDSSGDGILLHMSGGAYRMGAEQADEFEEPMAPGETYGKLLGHSMYFYTKDVGHAVDYVAPDFALKDVPSLIPRFKSFKTTEHGCSLWWIEWGGRLDTIHQSEEIKAELQKIVYGVWGYIKNSGEFPEAKNLTLEWVGTIPGKRESRRAEGDYMLRQRDIIEQVEHEDNIAHGGWSIDLHPADGVYAKQGCNQYHSKGVFGIPYRCMYSRNITNLFTNGRLLSASHVAFGSTRVMATSSTVGQAIGTAAALCIRHDLYPLDLLDETYLTQLKTQLVLDGHYVPNFDALEPGNLATSARLKVSSEFAITELAHDAGWKSLTASLAQMLPARPGLTPKLSVPVKTSGASTLEVELRISEKPGNHTPETLLQRHSFPLSPGQQTVEIPMGSVPDERYQFVCFIENPDISVGLSSTLLTGIQSVKKGGLDKVSTTARQEAPDCLGVESFDFWVPERRPAGQSIAFTSDVPLHCFGKDNLLSGETRPKRAPNAWVADMSDSAPEVELEWEGGVEAEELILYLDCDYDHSLESVQYTHADRVMPLLVHECEVLCNGALVADIRNNRMPLLRINLPTNRPIEKLTIRPHNTQGHATAMLGIRVR